jgi:alpha-D-xyloside xylohydrolase
LDTQYFLGPNLLVAPVFCQEGEVRFYVPEEPSHGREEIKKRDGKGEGEGEGEEEGGYIGKEDGEKKSKWVSWFDHSKTYTGGKWYTETHGFDTLPLLIRPGTVTPVNWSIKSPEEDFTLNGLEVLVNGPIRGILEVQLVDSKNPEKVKEVLKLESKGESGEVVVSREGVKVSVVG